MRQLIKIIINGLGWISWYSCISMDRNPDQFVWGTYRPNLFFGTKFQSDSSILTGLMWHSMNEITHWEKIRHSCEQNPSEFPRYGYVKHNGRSYGEQTVEDKLSNFILKTTFVQTESKKGDWAVKIQGKVLNETASSKLSLYYYIGLEEDEAHIVPDSELNVKDKRDVHFTGFSPQLGNFTFHTILNKNGSSLIQSVWVPNRKANTLVQLDRAGLFGFVQPNSEIWKVQDRLKHQLQQSANHKLQKYQRARDLGNLVNPKPEHLFFLGRKKEDPNLDSEINLYLVQYMFEGNFELDILFNTLHETQVDKKDELTVEALPNLIHQAQTDFDLQFEQKFHLHQKNFSQAQVEFAKAALSNLLGGIGHFHGDSILKLTELEIHQKKKEERRRLQLFKLGLPYTPPTQEDPLDLDLEEEEVYGEELEEELDPLEWDGQKPEFVDETRLNSVKRTDKKSLLSAVPSRPFFPRGFLWDEGFHQLLILEWDLELSVQILDSWFQLMDEDGYIAREQILGDEARSKVPLEFQTQHPDYANPPTLYLVLNRILDKVELAIPHHPNSDSLELKFLDRYSTHHSNWDSNSEGKRLDQNLDWNQLEFVSNWLRQIYPKLKLNFQWYLNSQSGDLQQVQTMNNVSWVFRWRGRTRTHCLTSGLDDYPRPPMSSSELHLDLLTWVGYMAKVLARLASALHLPQDTHYFEQVYSEVQTSVQVVHWSDSHQAYCDLGLNALDVLDHHCHLGYLSLFPLLLDQLPPTSPHLLPTLKLLVDPQHLATPFGIRSLSTQSPHYDPDQGYWKAPIWVNLNYLLLKALNPFYKDPKIWHQLGVEEKQLVEQIYPALRSNLIQVLSHNYQTQGYLFEQYHDLTGKGKKSHPFTGWSALVVLIMAEIY